jgi:3-hydroxybutyrate dehydrogenase
MRAICTGVSGSIGYAIAERFLTSFPDVHFIGTYHQDAGAARDLLVYPQLELRPVNLSEPDSWDLPGEVDYLISCAGLGSGKEPLATVPRAEVEDLLAVNLKAPLFLAQRAIPHMVKNRFGRIVHINSIWGLRGSQQNGAYVASKHGLTGLTKAIAKDYGRLGITCNDVCPGAVASRMMDNYFNRVSAAECRDPIQERQNFEASLNSGRMANPFEVADVVVFLCQPASGHINGTSIVVDGGQTS